MTIARKRFNFNLVDYVGTIDQTRGVTRIAVSPILSVNNHKRYADACLLDEQGATEYFANEVIRYPLDLFRWNGSCLIERGAND